MGWFSKSPNAMREKALRGAPAGPLRDYLSVPLPDPSTPLDELPLLAVDLETTGLDPTRDHVLSVGFVPVDGGEIVLSGARRVIIAADAEVGQSATVHGLTDDDIAAGAALVVAIEAVLRALRGRVLLAHFARIEDTFLTAACERLWSARMPSARVDTLTLQHRLVASAFTGDVPEGGLRLWGARAHFGLPVYRAHDALVDALACAELYLAQAAEFQAAAKGPLTLASIAE